jgi:hypothetical protein
LGTFIHPLRDMTLTSLPALSATRVSGRVHSRMRRLMQCRLVRALARPSLCLLLAVMPAGCLVTSVPEFEEPPQTPPFLIASTADPDLREFVLVVDGDDKTEFSASVISEDRGEPVQVALYIDYGVANAADHPFRRSIAEFPDIPPATFADGQRPVNTQWYQDSADVLNGCHTITMMVTHAFDFLNCPKSLSDSSHLTWKILRCTSKELCEKIDPLTDCPNSTEDSLRACPSESPGAGGGGSQ